MVRPGLRLVSPSTHPMSCLCYFETCIIGLIGSLLWPVSVPAKRTDLLLQLGSLSRVIWWDHRGPRASVPLHNSLPPLLRDTDPAPAWESLTALTANPCCFARLWDLFWV